MKLNFNFSPFLSAILISLLFLYGFSDTALTEIETAIIEKDYQKAKDLAQGYLDQSPSQGKREHALYYLGLSQLWLQEYAQARDAFRHLLKYSSDKKIKDKARLGMIDSFYMQEKYSEALQEAEETLKASPKSEYLSLIYLKIARSNLKLTQWDKAKEYLRKIADQFPNSPETHIAKQLLEEEQYFAVQLGAFLDRQRAENLLGDLKKMEEYAYIIETTDKEGRKFYRVRVGQLSTLNEAQELKSRLSQLGYPTQIYP